MRRILAAFAKIAMDTPPSKTSSSKTPPALSDGAAQAAVQARPWAERLARLGYAAKGLIYLIVGVLAAETALGRGEHPTNTQGALDVLLHAPLGRPLLAIVAVGLVGYALWRLAEALLDAEGEGKDAKGVVTRVGYAASGLIYGGLAWTAARRVSGASVDRSDWAQVQAAHLLSTFGGRWLLGGAGLIVLAVGLYGLYAAWAAPFRDTMTVPARHTRWVTGLGRFGFGARGVVFSLIGADLLRAAFAANAYQVRGMQGAQAGLEHQPGGAWLLLCVAAGLTAYGVFMLAEARCHQIRIPVVSDS